MPRRKGQKNRPKSENLAVYSRERSSSRGMSPNIINVAHAYHAPNPDQMGVIAIAIQEGNAEPTIETFVLPRTDCYRAECASAARAVTRCEAFSRVILHTTTMVERNIRFNLPTWRRNGWVTQEGKSLVAKDAWKLIDNSLATINLQMVPFLDRGNYLGHRLFRMAHDTAVNEYEVIQNRALASAADRQELSPNFFEPSQN